MKSILLSILVFVQSMNATAQYLLVKPPHRDRVTQQQQQHDCAGCMHLITVNLGSGSIGGSLAGSAALEYEQFLDKRLILSATLKGGGFTGTTLFIDQGTDGEVSSVSSGYFIAPGARVHLLGSAYDIDLALGVSAPLGRAVRRDDFVFSYGGNIQESEVKGFFGAAIGELTASFLYPRYTYFFSMFLSGGYAYSRPENRTYVFHGGSSEQVSSKPGWVQLGVRLGGRW